MSKELESLSIYIDDTPALTIEQLHEKISCIVKKHHVKIVFVDYVQLMESVRTFPSRQDEISYIQKKLKQTATEENITIIAIAQLCKSFDDDLPRSGIKRPILADYTFALTYPNNPFIDKIFFLHLPYHYIGYGKKIPKEYQNMAELIYVKDCNQYCIHKLYFDAECCNFDDWKN